MIRYEIFCTEEQTKKAMELGAPIRNGVGMVDLINKKYYFDGKGNFVIIPTIEQMLGWLEEQGLCIDSEGSWSGRITMWVWDNTEKELVYTSYGNSRQETYLVAIDAALNYLIKNK